MPRTRPLASHVGDRRSRRAAALAAAAVLACTLTACTPPAAGDPARSDAPAPTASAAPIFASDEEALAAAVAAYEDYLKVSDEILADGGRSPERIAAVTTGEYVETSLQDFAAFQKAGLTAAGATAIDSARLAEWTASHGTAAASVYVCQDVSGVRLLNASGTDVTPADRDDRIPLLIELETDKSAELMVSGNQVWSGDDFC